MCGKSTLIKKEIEPYLSDVGGYFVQRLFRSGEKVGFKMIELQDKESYTLEKTVDSISQETDLVVYLSESGRWESCIETFEKTGAAILERSYRKGKKLVLMDELGRVEQNAPRFRAMVEMLLDAPIFVLGVLKKEKNPFLDRLRGRDDLLIIDLDSWDYQEAEGKVRQFLSAAGLY